MNVCKVASRIRLPATDTYLPATGMQLSADIQCAYCYSCDKQLLPRCKNAVTS